MRVRGIRNLLDLPLVTAQQVHMGDVEDVKVDPTEQRVVKLGITWVAENRQVSGSDLELPFDQIVNFDPHQVVVADEIGETAGLDLLNYDESAFVSVTDRLLDRPITTEGGERLGEIVDVFFDEDDGAILGYEVTNEDIEAEHRRTRILSPTTDMDFKDGEIVIPDKIRTTTLAAMRGLQEVDEENREDEDYVFERDEPDTRSQQPELDEEVQDPNAYPEGHRVGFSEETPDSLLG